MNESPLGAWESFYVIVGSSGAALTGLQFVTIALVAELRRRSSLTELGAYATPTIVHFGAVLLVSAILSAPWRGLGVVALLLAALGGAGVGYTLIATKRALRQTGYRPVLEDWTWHTVLPLASYGLVLVAGATLVRHAHGSLFAVGTASVLLLVIGIHNAWDAVTYMTVLHHRESEEARSAPTPTPPQ